MAAPNPTDVGRKLRQHDNELAAVYDLLTAVDGKVDTLEAKVDTLEFKVDTLGAKVDTLEVKVVAGFERLESGQRQLLDLLSSQQGDSISE